MNYAQIRKLDISNGNNVGVSLFVQGCPIHCFNCFNKTTWDPNGGKPWTQEVEKKFLDLVNRDYIKRVSFLGGEPLYDINLPTIKHLLQLIPNTKTKWIYTGYRWENLTREQQRVVTFADYVVDGPYVDNLKDMKLEFRGSSNQRIIDVKKSLETNSVVLKEKLS